MSYEYEIEIETPAYVDPNLVAQRTREVIKKLLEKYGVFTIEAEARVATAEKKEEVEEEA
ncbi:MAG: hypothetical protein JZD41_07875 [Thermoproteus sp.]|nr:hypothetical protein [Thermoproteus sp.]